MIFQLSLYVAALWLPFANISSKATASAFRTCASHVLMLAQTKED